MVVCVPVELSDPSSIIDGSVQRDCAFCGLPVWVSQSSQVVMLDPDLDLSLQCMYCVLKEIKEDPKPMDWQIAPGALKEMSEYLLKQENTDG